MPFLPPNQQCQSIEGTIHTKQTNANDKITVKDYIFNKKSCMEKILKYKLCRVVDHSKKVPL